MKNSTINKNNTGEENSGDYNSGTGNSGDSNSGDNNSGNHNTWNQNAGNGNSGVQNSGYGNSGFNNSGYNNSGNNNSGNYNSGYGNSTKRESGIFCSEQGTVRIFNKPTDKKWDEIEHPDLTAFRLTEWIPASTMLYGEKKANLQFYVTQGYLKKYEYKEAWANFWRDTTETNRNKFLALPNFDAQIFKDITGIEAGRTNSSGKIIKVELDGVNYEAIIK